ncbi:hypothetical protein [Pontibacter harenae]|uniref:hypothetical protein n=1 Tax=Pontibacter harenae TaxID=2894083 RepID=UPI001E62EB89|nr:hypothetical protein [Pontibacter harenae]MCC9167181.1 hypothetical protein [Pontibacter harenae]
MLILHLLLTFRLFLLQATVATPQLQKDLEKDFAILQSNKGYYINDNSTLSPSLQTIANDLQLFSIVSLIDLSKAKYDTTQQGPHNIRSWHFEGSDIKAIYEVESAIHLDTVVTQDYLDQPSKQQRITNDFTFRTYAVSTVAAPLKLYYLTEAEQGLLTYSIEQRKVEIGYGKKKEGLTDVLPMYTTQVEGILGELQSQ